MKIGFTVLPRQGPFHRVQVNNLTSPHHCIEFLHGHHSGILSGSRGTNLQARKKLFQPTLHTGGHQLEVNLSHSEPSTRDCNCWKEEM